MRPAQVNALRMLARCAASCMLLVAFLSVPAHGEGDGARDGGDAVRVAAIGLDAAIERRVRQVIKGDARFLDTNLEVEVRGGLVKLRGLFQDPNDLHELDQRISAIAGVRRVEIEAVMVASDRSYTTRSGRT